MKVQANRTANTAEVPLKYVITYRFTGRETQGSALVNTKVLLY